MAGRADPTARAIEEQKRYYDVTAPGYLTGGPTDRTPGTFHFGVSDGWRGALVDELRPTGDVLELGCGPGGFTRELARHARSVTAVEASPQMLARNEVEVARANVRYVEADVFGWQPETSYDVVFFGLFLSHVPPALFESFWDLVRASLREGGRIAFVDEDERASAVDDLHVVDGVPVARRTLTDGRQFDVVKVFWNAEQLATALRGLDWDVTIRHVGGGLMYGVGGDARRVGIRPRGRAR
jgi:demethylmenaquinone methyltransferase/2-methoxy-6-polyprenyl-1,4-benzoquinol methylase